ncbi:MAG: lipoyl(octanoyl) transferase LipB [Fidelibacterota bacterium]|nr:MAG: lipoyl(octanoyl) transferase LipB [Candidatus Neomarinimicrobiota bacterium]
MSTIPADQVDEVMGRVASVELSQATTVPKEWSIQITPGRVRELAARIRAEATASGQTVFQLGIQPFRPVWELQKRLHGWRTVQEIPDVVLLLEHDPVYTLGKNADDAHLLSRRPSDAEVIAIDRGGDVTFHGPGQLVGYPIIDLREHRPSVTWYMRGLEGVIIRTLASYGVAGERIPDLPGVWIHRRKVAALGVRLARWTTMHGFALNVHVPTHYFDGMIPCGILEYGITNLNDHLSQSTTVGEVSRRLVPILQEFLGERDGQVSRLH